MSLIRQAWVEVIKDHEGYHVLKANRRNLGDINIQDAGEFVSTISERIFSADTETDTVVFQEKGPQSLPVTKIERTPH